MMHFMVGLLVVDYLMMLLNAQKSTIRLQPMESRVKPSGEAQLDPTLFGV
jgi:hypothetical protein